MRTALQLVLALWILSTQRICAQPEESMYTRNCLYVELLGQGILYSVNYEYRFAPSLSGRIGFTSWSLPSSFLTAGVGFRVTGVPLMVNYLTGEGNSHLELGVGGIIYSAHVNGEWAFWKSPDEDLSGVLGTATLGYRYQPTAEGFFFKIGATPMFNESGVLPTGGLSLGYAF